MNIFETIKAETGAYSGKTAVIESGVHVSYGELLARSADLAAQFKGCGFQPGQRIGIMYEDSIDYIIISLAVLSLSAVIVPIPCSSSPPEISSVIKEIKLDFLIMERDLLRSGRARHLSCRGIQKEPCLYTFSVREQPPREFYRLNPAFVRFSSGTTSKRKGIVLSHETIRDRTDAADRGLKITADDRIAWVLSMSFHFVVTIILFLRRAATLVLVAKDFPRAMLKNLPPQSRATFFYASPFHYHLLNCDPEARPDSLAGLRLAVSTATGLPASVADGFYQKFGMELCQAYGIIEVGLPFINDSRNKARRNSVGRMLPGYRMKIADPDKEGVGGICLQGKGMLDAYFSPWQNRRDILENGWFNTGDVGREDKDGFLYITGRNTSVINFCGMKIFPEEVESVINRHPAVKESIVYGIRHPQYGQTPVAEVVLAEGASGSFNLESLRLFCYQRLTSYKVPKEFKPATALKKTRSGKLSRNNSF